MKTELIKISEVIPYKNNPREISQTAIDRVASSIKEFGWQQPIVIDSENIIIVGHTRYLAAKKLNEDFVPIVRALNLTPAQVKSYRIADNKLNTFSDWDMNLLGGELEVLKSLEIDLETTGFDLDEVDQIFEDLGIATDVEENEEDNLHNEEDNLPEVGKKTIAKLGDMWILGRHRILCGNSSSIDAIDKLTGETEIDMVLTDPPYGIDLDTDYSTIKGGKLKNRSDKVTKGKKYSKIIGDDEDFDPSLILARFKNAKEMFLWGADYYTEKIPNKNDGSWIVWDKRLTESADKMIGSCFELCWSQTRHKRDIARIKWAGFFGTEKEFDKKRFHPTQKPIGLSEWFIENYGKDCQTVIDLYLGSGSTLLASEKLGKTCYGLEIAPQYIDVVIKRWQNLTGQNAILESTQQTFNELEDKEANK